MRVTNEICGVKMKIVRKIKLWGKKIYFCGVYKMKPRKYNVSGCVFFISCEVMCQYRRHV